MPDRDKEYKIGDVKMDNGARRRGPGPRFAEKPKNFRGTLGKLLRYLGRYRFLLLVALLLAAGNNILTLVGPGRLAEMTRLMTEGLKSGGIDVAAVTRVATTLAGLYGISFLFGVLQGELMATVTQGTSRSLRRDISQKINRLPLSYFDGTTVGDILSVIKDTGILEDYREVEFGVDLTIGDIADFAAANEDLQPYRDKGVTIQTTLGEMLDVVGKEQVQQLLQEKAVTLNYNPKYAYTKENVGTNWFNLLIFILVFPTAALIALQFIDNDREPGQG